MKKITVLLAGLMLIAGCSTTEQPQDDILVPEDDATTSGLIDETSTPDSETSFVSYEVDTLGLSFSYPEEETVTIVEDLNRDQEGKIGTVSLMRDDSVIADMEVVWIDSPTHSEDQAEHLWKLLTDSSETCSVEEVEITNDRETYQFTIDENPYEEGGDVTCNTNAVIYTFPGDPNRAVIVSTGQTPPFDEEGTAAFFNSVTLTVPTTE
jgi:hypothetical protein